MTKSTKRIGRPTKEPNSDDRVQLGLRVRADVKRRLDEAAKRNGRSQSQEAELMIERGLLEEDQFGGPELLAMARLMAAAFARGGQAGARSRKHPKWTPARWLQDPWCYLIACKRVAMALAAAQPEPWAFQKGVTEDQQRVTLKIQDTFAQIVAGQDFAQELEEGDRS